jgi:hypothetical protein
MTKTLTNAELRALIPAGSAVYYCRASRGICVLQTSDASQVLAILNGDETATVARRARLIACIPLLLDAVDEDLLRSIGTIVGLEPDEDDPRSAWPPPDWISPEWQRR